MSLQASLASEIRAAYNAHLVIEPIPEKEGSGSNLEKNGSDIMVLPPHTGGETRPLYPIFRLPNSPQDTGTLPTDKSTRRGGWILSWASGDVILPDAVKGCAMSRTEGIAS